MSDAPRLAPGAGSLLALLLLSSGDPAGAQSRIVPLGTPVVDGAIGAGEWSGAGRQVFHRMHSPDSKIETFAMWDAQNLYLAASVSDRHLWEEGHTVFDPDRFTGDDSIEWYIDADYDRTPQMEYGDFLFQVSAAEGLVNVFPGLPRVGLLSEALAGGQLAVCGTQDAPPTVCPWTAATGSQGTLNNNSDDDVGFTAEVALPWSVLGVGNPSDGMPLGMSIFRWSDDDGGDWQIDPTAVTTFYSPNEWVTSRGGLEPLQRRPNTWATAELSDPDDSDPPAQVVGLTAAAESPYSVVLTFTAVGDNGTNGTADSYVIRYSDDAAAPLGAFVDYPNRYLPQPPGSNERLRVVGLEPGKSYRFVISARDEEGAQGTASPVANVETPPASPGQRGTVVPSPNGRYLVTLDGRPVLPMGHAIPLGLLDSVFQSGEITLPEFFQMLESSGVTTMRVFAEDLHAEVLLEPSPGVFDPAVLAKLTMIFDLARQHGLFMVLTPWDTFFGPYGNEFYSDPAIRGRQKERLTVLHAELGSFDNLLLWELVNEYDNTEWNGEPEATRQAWFADVAAHLRGLDSRHMIAPSFNTPNPHGPHGQGGFVYNDPIFDLSSFHLYYPSIPDPNVYYGLPGRNPDECASGDDKGFLPGQRVSQALKFAYGQIPGFRPIFSSESGPIASFIGPSYSPGFTMEDDERLFNAMNWSHLAGGGVGAGLRYTAPTTTALLTDKMYQYYGLYSAFVSTGVDWANYGPTNVTEEIEVDGIDPCHLARAAISDGHTAIVYLTYDAGLEPSPAVGTTLTIGGFAPECPRRVEYWDASDASARQPVHAEYVATSGAGELVLPLPGWTTDIAIKVPEPPARDAGWAVLCAVALLRRLRPANGRLPRGKR